MFVKIAPRHRWHGMYEVGAFSTGPPIRLQFSAYRNTEQPMIGSGMQNFFQKSNHDKKESMKIIYILKIYFQQITTSQ